MSVSYRLVSHIYNLIDVLYFRKQTTSPRTNILSYIEDQPIHVLELCTGTATNAINIARHKKNPIIYGIDRSSDMLSIANKKLNNQKLDHIILSVQDATATSFANESFDIVLISLVLHEISEAFALKILEEAKRVLKSNGKILIIEWERPKDWLKKLIFYSISVLEPKGFKQFLKQDFNAYFGEKGLEIKTRNHCDYSQVFVLEKMSE